MPCRETKAIYARNHTPRGLTAFCSLRNLRYGDTTFGGTLPPAERAKVVKVGKPVSVQEHRSCCDHRSL